MRISWYRSSQKESACFQKPEEWIEEPAFDQKSIHSEEFESPLQFYQILWRLKLRKMSDALSFHSVLHRFSSHEVDSTCNTLFYLALACFHEEVSPKTFWKCSCISCPLAHIVFSFQAKIYWACLSIFETHLHWKDNWMVLSDSFRKVLRF